MAVGWGVIGAGGIASRRTIPEGILPARGARLAAVMDVDAARAQAASERFGGVPWFTEIEPLLARGDVEAVYIATPTIAHAPQALAAIAAGKHVLVEKPLAMTVAQGRRLAAAAKRKGILVGTGFMMRHHGAHVKIRQLIESGAIGKPVMGRAQLSCWYPPIAGAWRQDPALGGGGSFADMGNHCFDLLEMFLGRVAEVHAFLGNVVHDYQSEDTALVTFRFASGALGVVDNLFNVPDEASRNVLEIYGSTGGIRCEGTIGQTPGGTVRLVSVKTGGYDARQQRAAAKERAIPFRQVNTYRAEIEDFTRAVRTGGRPAVPLEDGLWNLRVVEAAYRSACTGRVVRL
ncbi:MAG TPA: Gfo/Idh/MocA family oxidoreductase [Planctomycetota bacterium]|nr:Gfo/Idh/MocA family oxidoreductase [Planctomycetota bacterium]HRR79054.1 Gfo/Idh/MocA family oxidoreductase [Planctomycetota bacterium]HRT93004.1 Gfo/Idh/MocA family oxidoreductase [Planctomycetota bacterium]